jgi:hypothetical protein
MCLRGASEVESKLFANEPSPRLRGYAVWVPASGGRAEDVASATTTANDPRIVQLWDERGLELTAFRAPLHLSSDAWDVYLAYAPGVRWQGATPPVPSYFMHQLDALDGSGVPELDGAVFATHARALLPHP